MDHVDEFADFVVDSLIDYPDVEIVWSEDEEPGRRRITVILANGAEFQLHAEQARAATN